MKNQKSIELVHSALEENTLQHHGIMGMKWGIRRYQPYPSDYTGDGKYVGPKGGSPSASLNRYEVLERARDVERRHEELSNKIGEMRREFVDSNPKLVKKYDKKGFVGREYVGGPLFRRQPGVQELYDELGKLDDEYAETHLNKAYKAIKAKIDSAAKTLGPHISDSEKERIGELIAFEDFKSNKDSRRAWVADKTLQVGEGSPATLFAKKGHVLFVVDENDGCTAKVANDVSRNIKSITQSAMDDFVKEYMKSGGPDKFYIPPGLTESELRKLFSVGCVGATASDYSTDAPACTLYIVANNNAKKLSDSWWKKLAERTQNATDSERYRLDSHELSYAGAVVDYDISNGAAKKKLSYVGSAD